MIEGNSTNRSINKMGDKIEYNKYFLPCFFATQKQTKDLLAIEKMIKVLKICLFFITVMLFFKGLKTSNLYIVKKNKYFCK